MSAVFLGLYFFYNTVTSSSTGITVILHPPPSLSLAVDNVYNSNPYNVGNEIPSSSSSVDSQILLLSDQSSLSTLKVIEVILQTHRISYTIHFYSGKNKHQLEERRIEAGVSRLVGRYCLIICTNIIRLYKNLDSSHLLDYLRYSSRYNVTFINFINTKSLLESITTNFGDFFATPVQTKDIQGVLLNSSRNFYYLKTDDMVTSIPPETQWTTIDVAHSKLEVLAEIEHRVTGHDTKHVTSPVVVVADGRQVDGEGFMHVLIGAPISFWLTKLMLLEVIRSYVSSPRPLARFGRKRWLMVDIDDVFIFSSETHMTPQDVQVFYADTLINS